MGAAHLSGLYFINAPFASKATVERGSVYLCYNLLMKKSRILQMTLCALLAAMTAALSQIAIPIGPVPFNLATFAVFLAGALLGSKLGALSLTIWAALGAVGVPVFSSFRSGLGALAGPTGGFIIGFIPAAFLTGLIIEKLNKKNQAHIYVIAMLAGTLVYFSLGTAWFMFSAGAGLFEALTVCVFPFIPGDLLKLAVATILVKRLRPLLNRVPVKGEE